MDVGPRSLGESLEKVLHQLGLQVADAPDLEPQIDNGEANDKPTVLALREIAARRIDPEYIDAVEKAERERKEREALEWAAAEVVADDDMSKGDD